MIQKQLRTGSGVFLLLRCDTISIVQIEENYCMKEYDLIIEDATVLTMDASDTVIEDGFISIKNGAFQ